MPSKDTTGQQDGSGDRGDLAELLAGCRARDRRAQQRLYDLYHQKVFRLMVRMVGLQDAPDVTQQVFLRVFRKIDQFTGQAAFATWPIWDGSREMRVVTTPGHCCRRTLMAN